VHLTDLYIASGQAEKVRSQWEQAYPAFFDPSPEVYAINASYAKDVARVLMTTGELEQANRLIEEALAVVRPQVPYERILSLEASLHAVAGDDSKALDAIRRCLDAGGSPYDLMMQDELKRFEGNPEYQAMAEKRKAEIAIQLKRIREMETNGELAPIPELPGK
jgi:tetratricopeptide (TPR) repeat protein